MKEKSCVCFVILELSKTFCHLNKINYKSQKLAIKMTNVFGQHWICHFYHFYYQHLVPHTILLKFIHFSYLSRDVLYIVMLPILPGEWGHRRQVLNNLKGFNETKLAFQPCSPKITHIPLPLNYGSSLFPFISLPLLTEKENSLGGLISLNITIHSPESTFHSQTGAHTPTCRERKSGTAICTPGLWATSNLNGWVA